MGKRIIYFSDGKIVREEMVKGRKYAAEEIEKRSVREVEELL